MRIYKTLLTFAAAMLMAEADAVTVQGLDVDVQFFTPSIVRVYKVPQGSDFKARSLSIIKTPETVEVGKTVADGKTIFKTSDLQVELEYIGAK